MSSQLGFILTAVIGWLEIFDYYNLIDKGNLCHFILIKGSPQNIEALFDN